MTNLRENTVQTLFAEAKLNIFEVFNEIYAMPWLLYPSYRGLYFDMPSITQSSFIGQNPTNTNLLFHLSLSISNTYTFHRQTPQITIFDLVGSLGGVFELLLCFFSFIYSPFSHFSFLLSAFSYFYLAKTHLYTLFMPRSSFSNKLVFHEVMSNLNADPKDQLYPIVLTKQSQTTLFLISRSWFCKMCCRLVNGDKAKKLERLYEKGRRRLNDELNVRRFIKNLREFKIMVRNSLEYDPEVY